MPYGRGRRGLKLGLAVAIATVGIVTSGTPVAGGTGSGWFNSTEKCMLRKVNHMRARHGLRRLDWDRQLGFVARRHARTIARAGGLFHDDGLGREVTRWSRLGQNTGRGGRCGSIMRAFKRSSSHRAAILGRWRFIGVGAEWRGGRLYVQQVFESRRNPGNVYHRP